MYGPANVVYARTSPLPMSNKAVTMVTGVLEAVAFKWILALT